MNLKKYIRLKAEKDAESLLTEEDRLFIQQLIEKNKEKGIKKKAKRRGKKLRQIVDFLSVQKMSVRFVRTFHYLQ